MTMQPTGWHVAYQRPVEYDILKSTKLLDPGNDALLSVGKCQHTRRFVVVDNNVQRIYGARIRQYFEAREIEAKILTFPGGEESKTVDGYLCLLDELDAFPIDRRDEPIIAIGGGVVTDVVGFVAGCYRRGVPHIKVPTTLVGYVDASIGVKTGVNFHAHKNRIGSFEPPVKVLLDKEFLVTLPERHILNGMCEILKLAVIADLPLFELLETHGSESIEAKFQDEMGAAILDRSIQEMICELQPDLFEAELARRMDFGHTFSYGLETGPDSHWLHGEAVLTDMLISAAIAKSRNLLCKANFERILRLVSTLGVTTVAGPVDAEILWESLEERTLHRDGLQRVPLPHGIGDCVFVNDVQRGEVQAACYELVDLCRR